MIQKTPAGAVCDEHPELGTLTDAEAWEHLQTSHAEHAAMAGRLVEEIGKANRPAAPQKARGKRRRKRRRR